MARMKKKRRLSWAVSIDQPGPRQCRLWSQSASCRLGVKESFWPRRLWSSGFNFRLPATDI